MSNCQACKVSIKENALCAQFSEHLLCRSCYADRISKLKVFDVIMAKPALEHSFANVVENKVVDGHLVSSIHISTPKEHDYLHDLDNCAAALDVVAEMYPPVDADHAHLLATISKDIRRIVQALR